MPLPPLYARWLTELHGEPPPEEPRTTCSTCPMTNDGRLEERFSPTTKCCTFFPDLPSFAVGGVLLDDEPSMADGKRRVRARIARGQQVTPLGITRPQIFLRLYGRGETFGVQPALRCPYFIEDGGRCGVWRHRESTCATWFCRHERGLLGYQYWTAQRHLLRAVEQGIATLVALDLGIDRDGLDLLLGSTRTVDRQTDDQVYRAMWEPWDGREEDYYAECHRRVSAMSWQDVLTRAEDNLDARIDEAREAFKALREAPAMPDLVRIRSITRLGGDGRHTLVRGYSSYDPIEMRAEAAEALLRVGQGTVDEIVAAHGDKGIDRPLLERLWEAGLLEGSSR